MPERLIFGEIESEVKIKNPPGASKATGVESLFATPGPNPADTPASEALSIANSLDPRNLGFAPPGVGPDLRMKKIEEAKASPLVPPEEQHLGSPIGKIKSPEFGSSITADKPITITQPTPSPLPKIEPITVRPPSGPSIPNLFSPPPPYHGKPVMPESDFNFDSMQRKRITRDQAFGPFNKANPPSLIESIEDARNFLQKLFSLPSTQ